MKSRSETLDTLQSCEVVSLDSVVVGLNDKPETPTAAREAHTETPIILEEANSEAVSLPTTRETSEVISIESSSDFYSEVHKIGSSSPDSIVQDTLKKDEDATSEKRSITVTESSTIEETKETKNIEENTEVTAAESKETTKDTVIETSPDTVSATTDKSENPSSVAQEEEEKEEEAKEETKDKPAEESNVATDDSNTRSNTEDSDKSATTVEMVATDPVAKDDTADTEEDTVPIVPSDETREALTVKVIEKLQLENDREIIDSDTSEAYLTPTENQESAAEMRSRTSEVERSDDDNAERKDVSEERDAKRADTETDESENAEEIVKTPNCSTSVVESGEDACAEKVIDLEEKGQVVGKKPPVIVNNALSSDEQHAVDTLTRDKSAVINDNEDEARVNGKHTSEPSTISTSVSDNKPDVTATTGEVAVTDSVCSNSDVQSSVDNVTQVPNPKQQIPTISTVCDATKSLSDGVPQIVSCNVVARDGALSSELTTDHVDTHRRASLPNVPSDAIVADDDGHEPPSLPVPLRKTSSPQKRPRSASTSTQVDPNHFGESPHS